MTAHTHTFKLPYGAVAPIHAIGPFVIFAHSRSSYWYATEPVDPKDWTDWDGLGEDPMQHMIDVRTCASFDAQADAKADKRNQQRQYHMRVLRSDARRPLGVDRLTFAQKAPQT